MKVYLDQAGEKTLLGEADVPSESGPVFEVPLFSGSSVRRERFAVGTVTHLPKDSPYPVVERAVLLVAGQHPELLPGWRPLRR
jgi:hypothetical protein